MTVFNMIQFLLERIFKQTKKILIYLLERRHFVYKKQTSREKTEGTSQHASNLQIISLKY